MTKKLQRSTAFLLSLSLCSAMMPTSIASSQTELSNASALPDQFLSEVAATAQSSNTVFLQSATSSPIADGEYILYSASRIMQDAPSYGLVGQSAYTANAQQVYDITTDAQIWSITKQSDDTYTITTGGSYFQDTVTTYDTFTDYVASSTDLATLNLSRNADGSVNIVTAGGQYLVGDMEFTYADTQESGKAVYLAQKTTLQDGNTYTVGTTGFNALVTVITDLNAADYTADSWDVLQNALNNTADISSAYPLAYASDSHTDLLAAQAEVNTAADTLYQAYTALEAATAAPSASTIEPTVSTSGYGQATIEWDTHTDAVGDYKLYRAEGDDFALVTETSSTTYLDTTLDSNTTYSYRVDYTNSEGTQIAGTVVKMQGKANLSALQDNAIVNYELLGTTFDGSYTLDVSDDIDLLQNVDEGSLLIRAKFTGTTAGGTTVNSLIHFAGTTPVYMGIEDYRTRYDFGVGLKSYAGSTSIDMADGAWHTIVMTVEGGAVKVSVDGDTTQGCYTDTQWAGFLSRNSAMEAITIGGGADLANWIGEISYITVTDQILTDAQVYEITTATSGANDVSALFNSNPDNTWVFAGSSEIKSSVDSIDGARTFAGHFEEYIRWTIGSTTTNTRQRYVFSTTPADGISLSDLNQDFEMHIGAYQPKAVAIMVDAQDFGTDIDTLETDLQGIVDQAYAIDAVPVFITPYASNDAATNAKIEDIIDMMTQVSLDNQQGGEGICVVDLYTDASTDLLNENDTLTADGHYAVGAAVVKAIAGGDMAFDGFGTEVVAPSVMSVAVAPVVSTTNNTVTVSLPDDYTAIAVQATYDFTIGNKTLSGTVGDAFTFTDCTNGEDFNLNVQATLFNGDVVILETVHGTVGGAITAQTATTTTGILDGLDNPTILFLGDSITHGAAHTYGYASVPQLFERALTEIGMGDSVILNVGVSSANASTGAEGTLNEAYKPYRLDRHLDADGVLADIVVIMLGTNDCVVSGMTTEIFQTNLEAIVAQVLDAGSIPVLRTPNPINASLGTRATNLPLYAEVVRKVAEEQGVLLVDHYAEWSALITGDMPYIINDASNKVWLNDGLHPNPNGQLNMFSSLFEAIAGTQAAQQSDLTTLSYTYDLVETTGTNLANYVTANADGFTLDTAALQAGTSQALEDVTMHVVANGQKITVTTDDMAQSIAIDGLASQTAYAVTVRANYASGNNQGYLLCFDDVVLYTGADVADGTDLTIAVTAQAPYAIGDTMGTLEYTQGGSVQPGAVFTLVDSATCSDNLYFTIVDNTLQIANPITKGETYQIRVQAEANGTQDTIILFVEAPPEQGTIYYNSDLLLSSVADADPFSAEELAAMQAAQSMTIVVEFMQENDAYGALFSLSNPSVADSYFGLIVNNGYLVMEHRESGRDDFNNKVGSAWPAPLAADEINTIALRATENQSYDFFVNGELVQQISLDEASYLAPGEISNISAGYVGKTQRSTAINGYPMLGSVYEIQVFDYALDDDTLLERTAQTPKVSAAYRDDFINVFEAYHSVNNTNLDTSANLGSNYFRIPSLLTTSQGMVIAATDLRYGGTGDSANNLDIGVRTKDAGTNEWNDVIAPAYFDDFSNADHIMNSSSSYTYNTQSASFIDPVLVEDTVYHDSRIYLVTDAFVSGAGSGSHSPIVSTNYTGTGFVEIDGKKYWKLKMSGDSDYNYYVDAVDLDLGTNDTRTIYRIADNTALEDYTLNANFEVVYQGEVQTVAQRSTTYTYDSNSMVQTGYSGENVAMNIMYDTSIFTVYPTMYMYMFYSDDQGATWSHPTNITGMVKPEEYGFFGVGPGVGIQIEQGDYAGRILVPTYTYVSGGQSTGAIYSDDGGITWHSGELVPLTNGVSTMSEAQYVELPDGSIRVYARTTGSYVGYATSLDGGATWSESQYDTTLPHIGGSGCQISIINYSQTIDGYPAVIFSGPTSSSRTNGVIRIGLIQDTGVAGSDRYQIVWRYQEEIITYDPDRTTDDPTYGRANYFAYSCLAEMPNGDVGVIYETTNLRQPLEDAMRYTEYTLVELMDSPLNTPVTPAYDITYTAENGMYTFDLAVVYDAPVRLLGNATMKLTDGTNTYDAIYVGTDDNQTHRFYAQVPAASYTVNYSNPSATSELGVAVTAILGDYIVDAPIVTYAISIANTTDGTVATDVTEAEAGDTITITATPSAGYEIGTILVAGASGAVAVTNNTFTMPDEAVTITVTFVAITFSMYDINQDGVVDATDLSIAQSHYRTTATDATWPAASVADVNKDNVITLADFIGIVLHYTA